MSESTEVFFKSSNTHKIAGYLDPHPGVLVPELLTAASADSSMERSAEMTRLSQRAGDE